MSGPRIGTAGWQIPRAVADAFPAEGSTLERYATRFACAEINTSFYRSHQASTWVRWAQSVPEHFRFAVKAPKTVSHERKLIDCGDLLDRFFAEIANLGPKLGPVLVQLPPSLAYDAAVVAEFIRALRERHDGDVVFEPRHPSWFTGEADAALAKARIARAAADPARVPKAAIPGGWPGLVYFRLHGSPRVYWSSYEAARLDALAADLSATSAPVWCIFDNTASGAAAANALDLIARL